MSSYIYTDAEAVSDFRWTLTDRANSLDDVLKATRCAIDTVGHTWRDDQFTKFRDIFENDINDIKKILENLDDLEDCLRKYEYKIREYENL